MNDVMARQRIVASKLTETLKKNESVEGIVLIGSIARNQGDGFSDIDLSVFSDERLPFLQLGEQKVDGWIVDIENISMAQGSESWPEERRGAYQNAIIAYDRGRAKQFINTATHYSDDYRMKRIITNLFELGWSGWSYSEARDREWKGYIWSLPSNLWIRRGRPDNAIYVLRQSIETVMDLLFAINKQWIPDRKWKWIKFCDLQWKPNGCDTELLITQSQSTEHIALLQERLQSIVDDCYDKIIPELPDDIYRFLMEHTDVY